MALWNGDVFANSIDWSFQPLGPGETAHLMLGGDGNDTITGGLNVPTFLHGESGNDSLQGGNADDVLTGGIGSDTLKGGAGDDLLLGQSGNDFIYSEGGEDRLRGETGSDFYWVALEADNDVINDDMNATNQTGAGDLSTNDRVYITNQFGANLRFFQDNDDLWITDTVDISDGFFDDYVVVEDFFLGGNNVIEYAVGMDNVGWDLTTLL